MLKRTLTGIVILLLVAGFVALRYVHIAFFDAFVFLISLIATYEVIKCVSANDNKKELIKFIPYSYVIATFVGYLLVGFNCISIYQMILIEVLLIILFFAISFIINIISLNKMQNNDNKDNNMHLILLSTNTMLYTFYPCVILSFLYKINLFGLNLGMIAIIMLFAISMSTDVFAYLTGTLSHGKGPRLCPKLSPKKGVIGMIGGSLFGIIAGLCGYFTFSYSKVIESAISDMSTAKSVCMFLLIGLFGTILTQIGDLIASSVKRNHGIKDYGKLFPGHGGVMDRVDGLMFNAISVYIIITLFII